jgi:SAM-dependent methyltransferase
VRNPTPIYSKVGWHMAEGTERLWVDSMPDAYDRYLVEPLFRPFALDLAARAAARKPQRILELAAGTGVVTKALHDAVPTARITATDLNQAMVDLGRRRVPEAEWRQADAQQLPFEDDSFDLLACQFGVMFFPDRPAALAEARRVLQPGGTLLLNTWGRIETHDFDAPVVAALHDAFPDDPPTFLETTPHGYHDVAAMRADLTGGGFGDTATIEEVVLEGRAPSPQDIGTGFCTGTPVRPEVEARGGDLAKTADLITQAVERRLGPGPIAGRMTAYVIEARA